MDIREFIEPHALKRFITFHKTLNPKLWQKGDLRLEVRVKLLALALEFYKFLETPGLAVNDVIFTGSNAAFNYTPLSDIDVHLIIDFAGSTCPTLAANFFTAKKTLWNQTHDVTIRGYHAELYVEDTTNPVRANGVYSIVAGEWLHQPKPVAPRYDDIGVLAKTEQYGNEIDALIDSKADEAEIAAMFERLRSLRKAGLAHGGEFSVENLAFKSLRNLGYLQRLADARTEGSDQSLSL